MSAHVGFPDLESCRLLKRSGVSQALIDVMGDDETAAQVYHLSGMSRVLNGLRAIRESGLQLIPHIVAGLHYGNIRAEYEALEIIRRRRPAALVVVVLTPLKGTPMEHVQAMVEAAEDYGRPEITKGPLAAGTRRPPQNPPLEMAFH